MVSSSALATAPSTESAAAISSAMLTRSCGADNRLIGYGAVLAGPSCSLPRYFVTCNHHSTGARAGVAAGLSSPSILDSDLPCAHISLPMTQRKTRARSNTGASRASQRAREQKDRILAVFSERAKRSGIRSVVMGELATELR